MRACMQTKYYLLRISKAQQQTIKNKTTKMMKINQYFMLLVLINKIDYVLIRQFFI